ncbi:MAG: hypothetical protein Q8P18_16155 [Pseudomonadota bacterium]|nr:hypothetical protein [Pseudomonadota bacterium]
MRPVLALALSACSQTLLLDQLRPFVPEPPARTIVEACERGEVEHRALDVRFPERDAGCEWGVDGNLDPGQGVISARTEDVVVLEMPTDVAICDVTLDFRGPDPESEQILRYDDAFILTLDDVVLAASYGPMVELLEEEGHLRLYDWDRLAGAPFSFADLDAYCLGAAEGLSTCTIPPPETSGIISLDFGSEIVDELADHAYRQQRYAFAFISVGDNDEDVDCSHAEFGFTVDVDYVRYTAD